MLKCADCKKSLMGKQPIVPMGFDSKGKGIFVCIKCFERGAKWAKAIRILGYIMIICAVIGFIKHSSEIKGLVDEGINQFKELKY